MDTRTGTIHERLEGETLQEAARRLGVPVEFLRGLGKRPDPGCYKCQGSGQVPKRKGSRDLKPCACTEPL